MCRGMCLYFYGVCGRGVRRGGYYLCMFCFSFASFLVPVLSGYFLRIYLSLLTISLSDLYEDKCKCVGVGACVGVHVCACIFMICVWGEGGMYCVYF